MLIKIAWRNVWRNKTRSLVIILAVALGLWGGIFSDAFMNGMVEQQVYSTIHTETGDIQLNKNGFLLNHDMQLRISNADSVIRVIQRNPEVTAVAPITQLTAMASTASGSAGIMLNGIDPGVQSRVSDLSTLLVQGSYFKDKEADQTVISQKLADKLHVKLHSRIVLTLQTVSGDITYGAFRVAGIYRTTDNDYDMQMVFVKNSDLKSLINFPEGDVSMLTVMLKKDQDADSIASHLSENLPGIQVQSWMELSPLLQLATGKTNVITFIFVGIILIALAFGIINTMLMAVLDRTREIGMLLSIGMRPSRVFGMILLETVFLSVTGAFVGVGISVSSIAWFGKTGINLSMIAEGFNALGYSSIVYPSLGPDFYIILSFMVIIIALAAGWIPARRAVRLKPAEAVRGE
jgi:ABC-type lipoprotein release transport system permease subunit